MPRSQHAPQAPPHPAPLVTRGACSPAHTRHSDHSLARCSTYGLLVPKHSPATMRPARYSYLSLTSAGVASDLPFVTLHGNKQGLARVGINRAERVQGVGVVQTGSRVKGCCNPSLAAAQVCWCAWALESHLLPTQATSAAQRSLAGFPSQAWNQEGKLLLTKQVPLLQPPPSLHPALPYGPPVRRDPWLVTPALVVLEALEAS